MNAVFCEWRDAGLVWLPERGMGYYPVNDEPYDDAYFRKYVEYSDTDLGRRLDTLRIDLVRRWAGPGAAVIDIGIGAGAFIEARGGETYGYDINPRAVTWLKDRQLWRDPREQAADALTFWDSLEHIRDPAPMLAQAREWVFMSLPIFTGPDHVLRSRHFRRDEHCWYWTRGGLIRWMAEHGLAVVEHGTPESIAGREDIHTFAFRRRS